MSTLTSRLILSLVDQVTGPAKQVSAALRGVTGTIGEGSARQAGFAERLNSAVTQNNRALASARGALADAAAAGFLLYRGVSAPITAAAGFEKSMNRVRALSNATEDEFAALGGQARELGRTTQYSASQASDAMGFLAMAGFSVDEIIGAMPGTLQLAAAGQIDLSRAADIASNVLSAYGMDVEQLGRVNDVLAATFTSTNTDLNQLAEAMKYAAPVASAAGVQFEEAAAAIGLMGNAGIQGSMAGTSLRGAIARILSPTRSVEDAMSEMGMTTGEIADAMGDFEGAADDISDVLAEAGVSFTDAQGRILPLVDIVRQLEPHADDAGLMMRLFGLRAGPAMAALVSQGAEALNELTDGLETSGGTAARIAETQMQGFEGKMMAFRSAVEGVNIAIGNALLPTLTAFAEAVTRLLGPVTQFAESFPQITQAVIGATAAIIGFKVAAVGLRYIGLLGKGGVLSMIALGYTTIGRSAIGAQIAWRESVRLQTALAGMAGQPLGALARLGAGFKGLALAVPGLAKAGLAFKLLGGTLMVVKAPLAFVAAAGFALYRYWDRLSAIFSGVASAIGEVLREELEWLADKLPWIGDAVAALADVWERVTGAIGRFASGVKERLGGLFGREVLSAEETADIAARAQAMTRTLLDEVRAIPGAILEFGQMMHAAGVAMIQNLRDGMVTQFERFLDWVRTIPQRIITAIGNIDLRSMIRWPERPAWLGGAGSAPGGGAEDIPARAKGGPISRGSDYWVGEQGPELITAARSGYVQTAARSAGGNQHDLAKPDRAASGSAQLTVSVNAPITITASAGTDPGAIASEVTRRLEASLREAFRGVYADTGMRFT